MDFKQRLQNLRKKSNMTQQQLAKAAHVSIASIINYENGRRMPQLDIAGRIAAALDTDTDYLLNGGYRGTLDISGLSSMSTEELRAAGEKLTDIINGSNSISKQLEPIAEIHKICGEYGTTMKEWMKMREEYYTVVKKFTTVYGITFEQFCDIEEEIADMYESRTTDE